MPVDYLPCLSSLALVAVPLILWQKNRAAGVIASLVAILALLAFILPIYLTGWRLHWEAIRGDPKAEYLYAQWLENHNERIQQSLFWPVDPDVYGGFSWLQRAAARDYAPAVWLVGARLKFGIFVPRPPNWTGPGGNVFAQPAVGQPLINRATNDLGYAPPPDAWEYYEQHYRKGLPP